MKTTIRLLIAILPFLCLSAGGPNAQAVVPPPDGGYPNFTTAEGQNALFSLTTGAANTAVGWHSLFSNTDGSYNTAVGAGTLLFNVGNQNTGVGVDNTAIGAAALLFNSSGRENTANGTGALLNNDGGSYNTAVGGFALQNNRQGDRNTAIGYLALANGNGVNLNYANTATGYNALGSNTSGQQNTATGASTLANNFNGDFNTAIGVSALINNVNGSENIGIGHAAGADITGDDNIDIGNGGVAGESNTIRIGTINTHHAIFIAGISGTPVTGAAVLVANGGQLGTLASSQRFKKEIQPIATASEAILALRPVSFRYKQEIDPAAMPQFGLIAEEVEKVNADLVTRDAEGKPYSVRYEAVNAMLLNEFLKEHKAFVEERHKVEELENTVAGLLATVKEQAGQIQKVNARLELRESSPQTVRND